MSLQKSKFDPSWRYSLRYYPNEHIVHRGWRILIPHGDIVDVIAPINIYQHIGQGVANSDPS